MDASNLDDDEAFEIRMKKVDETLDEVVAILRKLQTLFSTSDCSKMPTVESWLSSIENLLGKSQNFPKTTIAVAGNYEKKT